MPFNPAHVSGLYAWYRANTGATLGGTPLATGTTPPAVTIAATDGTQPTASGLRIEITTTGARGTADFRWSVNDGNTFEASAVLTAATVTLGSANITVTFPVGTYTSDNVYRATCSQWNDRTSSALHLSQATATTQPLRLPRDANVNTRPSMLFDNTNDSLQNSTVANWKLIHDGTGCTIVLAFYCVALPAAAGGYIVDTGDLTGPGLFWIVTNTGGIQTLLMNDAGLGGILFNTTIAAQVTAGSGHVFTYSYVEGAAPEILVRRNGTEITSGNSAVAPSVANPIRFAISGAAATRPLNASWGEVVVYNRQLTTAEMQSVERYMGREYGVTVA